MGVRLKCGVFTGNTNNIRLWDAKPKRGFDLNSFNGSFTHPFPPLAIVELSHCHI
jgi:hypothetical protein